MSVLQATAASLSWCQGPQPDEGLVLFICLFVCCIIQYQGLPFLVRLLLFNIWRLRDESCTLSAGALRLGHGREVPSGSLSACCRGLATLLVLSGSSLKPHLTWQTS